MIRASFITKASLSIISEIATLVVVIYALKRGTFREMHKIVKISLISLLLSYPVYIYVFTYMSTSPSFYTRDSILGFCFVINIWIYLHWNFTNLYFQTALLFRLTLLSHTDEEMMEVQRRKKCLEMIQIAGVCLIATFGAVHLFIGIRDDVTIE